ncbi:purine-binding chemotaxis protein CheW [bacterium SCSIO 12696]|nr:purine-binding chemotaxis protein CheW [bacterium SCSIO 12696]
MSLRASSAFQTLVALDTYCRQSDRRLPSEEQVVPTVSVVCFALQGQQFAVPFSDIVELLEVPHCTRLPRVQSWVRGVANVRGRLLPIIDLAEFVGTQLTTAPKQQRVLVMDMHGVFAGLQVDEVLGMRHFPVDTFIDEVEDSGPISGYLEGGYRDGDNVWGVFRPLRLASDVRFLSVTA